MALANQSHPKKADVKSQYFLNNSNLKMALPTVTLTRLDHTEEPLSRYSGKTLLVVNVASQCGFTSQYQGLELLWRKYQTRGLVVMGFPCNQFGGQEPGTAEEIGAFCSARFDVSFPTFEKCEVNGKNTHPFFAFLKSSAPGVLGSEAIKWNFTKFLVSQSGDVVRRYASMDEPEKIEEDLVALL
jgi:glutathione peroxidase